MFKRLASYLCVLYAHFVFAIEPTHLAKLEKEGLSDVKLAFNLGQLYLQGDDTTQPSFEKAEYWLKRVADGHFEQSTQAASQLGYLFLTGEKGFPIDKVKAEKFLASAVDKLTKPDHNVYFMLGNLLYTQGRFEEAIVHLEYASRKSNLNASLLAADIYLNAKGTFRNTLQAAKFLRVAAAHGHKEANLLLGEMYFTGTEIHQDYIKAIDHLTVAADKGSSEAQNRLGLIYLNGLGVEKNNGLAFTWFLKAADAGEPIAINNIALMYLNGDGTLKNVDKAIKYFKLGVELNELVAITNLALVYKDGLGVTKDSEKAKALLEKAISLGANVDESQLSFSFSSYDANKTYTSPVNEPTDEDIAHYMRRGDASVLFNLGLMYLKGEGVDADKNKAFDLFEKSALLNYAPAQMNIGIIHVSDADTEIDYVKGYAWLKVARNNNLLEAQPYLDKLFDGLPATLIAQANSKVYEIEDAIANSVSKD